MKNKTKPSEYTVISCVMCQEGLRSHFKNLFYCRNPKCPNYSLVCVGPEELEEDENKLRNKFRD